MSKIFFSIHITFISLNNSKFALPSAGCRGGIGRGKMLSSGLSGGGGHGGKGGDGIYSSSHAKGGPEYGNADLPCELGSGSGSGNDSASSTAGGGIIGTKYVLLSSVSSILAPNRIASYYFICNS